MTSSDQLDRGEHQQVSANGASFHVAVAGDGPLVLLLHGFPTFWWTWREVIPQLAAAGPTRWRPWTCADTAAATTLRGGMTPSPPAWM